MNKKHRLIYNYLLLKLDCNGLLICTHINSTSYVKEIKVRIPIYHAIIAMQMPVLYLYLQTFSNCMEKSRN